MASAVQQSDFERDELLQDLERLLSGEWGRGRVVRKSVWNELAAPWRLIESVASLEPEVRERRAAEIEDSGRAEQRVRSDYGGRYPIELLQNAQDACADEGIRGRAWFRVSETALLVANEGVPFDRARVKALLRLGGSSKEAGGGAHRTIGYKGIGFTSVFELSDRPQIISGDLAFGFDRELALREVRRRLGANLACVPTRYYPFPLKRESWSEDLTPIEALFDLGASTVVRLPFRRGYDRERACRALKDTLTATSLVLMPALDALEVQGVGSWRRTRGRQLAQGRVHHVKTAEGGPGESWFLSTRRVPIAGDAIDALDDELWAGVHDLEVSVGIPWHRGKPDAKAHCPSLHVYFPTDDAIGRKLLLHGDFYLDSTRRHVQTEGPGKAVTETALRAVIDLVVDCAEELNCQFPNNNETLVDILSPHDAPQGFGLMLGEALDKRLAETSFVKSVTGAFVSPQRCEVLDVSLDTRAAVDFVAMMEGADLLAPPHLEELVRNWLVDLGAVELTAGEVIAKLRPSRAPTYDRAVRAVSRWWRSTGRWGDDIAPLALLRSTDGEWCRAEAVCRPVGDSPPLPAGLALATYRPPNAKDTREFIDEEFDIRALDTKRAFDHVMRSIQPDLRNADAEECRELHDFAWAVFCKSPDLVAKHARRSELPVPVRKWRRGASVGWARAKDAYFTEEWSGNRDLETLYGPFGKREFLATGKPSNKRRAREWERFYKAIGVIDVPRQVRESSPWNAPHEWRKVRDVMAAQRCPDGHPNSGQVRAQMMDRLPEVLDGINLRRARALVRILAKSNRPYGTDAEIWCAHSSHRSGQGHKRVMGLQKWYLENSSWLPLKPAGQDAELGQPIEAWTHINSEALRACVRLADVSAEQGKLLGLPRMTQPRASALCQALKRIHRSFPDLTDAPDGVAAGVEQLLRKMERALKSDNVERSWLDALPARRMGEAIWSEKPAVPDLDLPRDLDLEVLQSGQWPNLREAFDLPLASECVESRTEFQGLRNPREYGLSNRDRAAMAAILHSKGSDLHRVSRELGRLSVKEADAIKTVFVVGSSRIAVEPPVHLEAQADGSALIVVIGPSDARVTFEFAQRLAEHLLNDVAAEVIFIYLQMRSECLPVLMVTDEDIREAQNAIRRYRRDDEPADEPGTQGLAVEESSQQGQSGTGRIGAPDSTKTDGEVSTGTRTSFGSSTPVARGGEKRFSAAPGTSLIVSNSTAPVRTGAAGGTGKSGGPSMHPDDRRDVEVRAIRTAIDYARNHLGAVEVRDVQLANRGWDLEIVFRDGSWWPVEVKGFGMTASRFILTRNELEAAKREQHFRLLLVTGVLAASGQVLCLEGLGSSLDAADLSPMSWIVSSWKDSVTSVTDWSETQE